MATARRGKGNINWLALRTYYMSAQNISLDNCAKRFGVSSRSVEMRASKEDWSGHRRTIFGEAAEKLNKVSGEGAYSALMAHDDAVAWAMRMIMDGEKDLALVQNPRSRIECRKFLAEGMDRALRMHRLISGLRDGQPSAGISEADQSVIYEYRVAENLAEDAVTL